jgi:hypothetical protein
MATILDTFPGSSINTSIWTETSGVSVGSGAVTITGSQIGGGNYIQSISSYTQGATLIFTNTYVEKTSLSSAYIGFTGGFTIGNDWTRPGNYYAYGPSSATDTGIACSTTPREFKIVWRQDGKAEFYIDSSLVHTSTETDTSSRQIRLAHYDNGKKTYCEEVSYLAEPPVVNTGSITSIDFTTATAAGDVISDSGFAITERGVCWSTSTTPTTANDKATSAGTTGAYTVSMTGLSGATHYYARAYATNTNGTTYGSQVEFDTYSVSPNTLYWDINGVSGETYAVSVDVGGTTGTVTVKLGSTGTSQVINAGAGTTVFQGTYGGLNGLIFEASGTFDGYIDNVYHVLILGDATINWSLDTLTNVFPINSSVLFKRLEDKDFDKFRVYRYLDIQFKDLTAYVTVLLKKEKDESGADSGKEFLVSNTSGYTLPFINKKVSMLTKNYGMRVGFSNNNLNETFTVCQFVISGKEQLKKTFSSSKIISIS